MLTITKEGYNAIRELKDLYIDLCYQLAEEENRGTGVRDLPCIKTIEILLSKLKETYESK